MHLDPVVLSRIQFAFTLSFHILFPTLTIGLALYLLAWEIAWLKTRRIIYYQLCRFWTKIFALAFGMGVVSGIVLSYEFGTNFSRFSEIAGNVLGPLMSYEVMTAFFLEAGFLGVMLFGWKRVPPAVHLFSTAMVAIGTLLSAFWILAANSWMQTPVGYSLNNGIFSVANWLHVIFNPSFPYRFMHMVVASLLSSSFLIAGIGAWYLIKQRHLELARATFSLAIGATLLLAPLQLLLGDMHGLNTFKYQTLKVSAMEGRWETERSAPLTLFAIPDPAQETNHYAIEIPKLGSIILTHELNGEIKGLKSVPKEDRPYVPIVFYSFRVMVGIGVLFILTAFTAQYLRMRKKLFTSSRFWRWCVLISPLGFVAVVTGWFTTETGRQPWIIYGLLRTRDAASILPASSVFITLIAFMVLYLTLLGTFIFYLLHLVRKGPEEVSHTDKPDRLASWLEDKP
ncbi:MAG TPA: cytochrome ubiquinol oxidase subunit I [Gammaproteobacteria bacterium]|nr:cytochrome ubiquinol oxidase subunit I [Gammaproteobacteria bacterium]